MAILDGIPAQMLACAAFRMDFAVIGTISVRRDLFSLILCAGEAPGWSGDVVDQVAVQDSKAAVRIANCMAASVIRAGRRPRKGRLSAAMADNTSFFTLISYSGRTPTGS